MQAASQGATTASSTRRSIAARPCCFPTLASIEANSQEFTYGRLGTPTVKALEEALAELEGGHRTLLTPSGLSAIAATLLAFVVCRRRSARLGQRLSADAALLRSRAEAARRQDHLLRPTDRRRDQGPLNERPRRCSPSRPARRPSRCRTFRRSRKPRMKQAPW